MENSVEDHILAFNKISEKILPHLKQNSDLLWSVYALCYDGLFLILPYRDLQAQIANCLFAESSKYRGKRLLSIGCATDPIEKEIKRKNITEIKNIGLDFSFAMLNEARKIHNKTSYLQIDLNEGLPIKSNNIDFIALTNVVEFIARDNIYHLFPELQRVIKKNGRLVITTMSESFKSITFIIREHLNSVNNDLSNQFWKDFTPDQFPIIVVNLFDNITDFKDRQKIILILLCNMCFSEMGGSIKTTIYPENELSVLCKQNGFIVKEIKGIYANQYILLLADQSD